MTTKHLAKTIAAALLAMTTAQASIELSPGTDLFFTGVAGLKYNDNIFLASSGEKSSAIVELIPGVSLEMGSSALTKNIFTFNEDFVEYLDASSQNTQLANAQYDAAFSDAKLSMKLNAGYHQLAQNSRDIRLNGVIVQTDVTNVSPTAELEISPKTVLGAGVSYYDYHYKANGYTDRNELSVPLNLYYEIAPKLQGSVGYRYRHTSVDLPGADSDDNYVNFGARGDFDPKLTGMVTVGYVQRKIKSVTVGGVTTKGSTESAVGLESQLQYAYSEKTIFDLHAKNDFGDAATGSSQKVFELGAGVVSAIDSVWSVDGSFSYSNYKYIASNRSDDFYQVEAGLTYSYNANVKFNASYNYQDNSSNLGGASFTNNVLGVSVILRY